MRVNIIAIILYVTLTTQGLFSQVSSYHQNFHLEWGEMNRFRGNVIKLFDIEMNSFSALVNRTPTINFFSNNTKHLKIKNITNLTPNLQGKIKLTANGKPVHLQGVLDIGDKVVAFSKQSRLFNRTTDLQYHKFNHFNLNESIDGELLGSYDRYSRYSSKFAMDFKHSLDQKKGAAFYMIPSASHDYPSIGYIIFDETKGVEREGIALLPYRVNEFEVYDEHLTNTGEYYIIGKHFYPHQNTKGKREFDQVELYKVVGNEIKKIAIEKPETKIKDMFITSDNKGNLFCTGFYSSYVSSQISGTYFFKLSKDSEQVENFTTSEVTVDFLSTDEPSLSERLNLNKRFTSSRNDFNNFSFIFFRQTDDGGFVAVSEHAELEFRMKGSGEGGGINDQYDLHYYYNDLIVYKMDNTGKTNWVKRIPKYQQSINDNATYLSASSIISNGKIYLLFNDHKKNYDENNAYINLSFPRMSTTSNRNNVMAITEIDLKSGTSKRHALPGRSELSTLFIPSLSRENINDNSLLLYSNQRNKHRFGKLMFK